MMLYAAAFFLGVLVGAFISALCVMAKTDTDDDGPRPPVRSWINEREVGAGPWG